MPFFILQKILPFGEGGPRKRWVRYLPRTNGLIRHGFRRATFPKGEGYKNLLRSIHEPVEKIKEQSVKLEKQENNM